MNMIVFLEIEEWEKENISHAFSADSVMFSNEKAQTATDPEMFEATILSTFIYSTLNSTTLSKFPNLKLIATRSTGYDHIDLDYCKQHRIHVVNVPSYGAHTVAEHTFALILALSRNIIPSVEQSRKGNYQLDGLRGFDLHGKTLGVIGAGKIGRKVVGLALCLGMNVLVYTRSPQQNEERVQFVSLEDLLSKSDIVSLHIPHTSETHHLINRETIKKFKKGSILINTARGPLVETQAILEGLETGILKAAGLDVLEEECSLKEERELLTSDYLKTCDIKTQLLNHVLLRRDDVIFTSHNAFNSQEALLQILDTTTRNIQSFLSGKIENNVA